MTIFLSQCMNCKHFRKGLIDDFVPFEGNIPLACDAFPQGIPGEVFSNEISHRKPIEGDGGIRYEPESKELDKFFK